MTEIVRTLGGFAASAVFAGLRSSGDAEAEAARARRFRETLESLGPSFVKVGQILSLHADELPHAYREELRRLFDKTLPLPFDVVEEVLRAELGERRSWLRSIDPEPLASASIGQVHRALLSGGEEVVVRCSGWMRAAHQRDLAILRRLTRALRVPFLLAS
jgi:ubiquinone biosynthesis protein